MAINDQALLSAKQATALLGIKLTTLYAYVSRGLVRSVPGEGKRARRYYRGDLELLKARHDARSGHGAVASGALRWGEPVLDSAITAIGDDGPRYRGHLAVTLAEEGQPFESVAQLLWTGTLPPSAPRFQADDLGCSARVADLLPEGATRLDALSIILPAIAARDRHRFLASDAAEHARGRTLLHRMAASLCLSTAPGRLDRALRQPSVARAIAVALSARNPVEAAQAIDRALVVSADHELNASTFATRIAASTGADLYACVASALAVLSGPLHGGTCDRVEALLSEIGSPERAASFVQERTRLGERIAGFGHRLYPRRDPRAVVLLDSARAIAPRSPLMKIVLALVRAMRDAGHEPPTVDLGLVAIAGALGLPPGSAVALFAIGRTAGWIAHVLEQRAAGFMLRPRARYVGP